MPYRTRIAAAIIVMLSAGVASAAPPKVVSAPNSDPQCFAPWAANTKFFQYPAKKGPYRIALANGFIANTWRIQMIKTAKAYAAQPAVAAKLKEFKVVSTGEDVAAQIAAINNFIDSGYDAIVVNAQNPEGLRPGDQARQGCRRRPGRLRQHPRHRRRHQRRRRPEGPRRAVGQLADQAHPERRQDPRSARRGRHLGRHRPPQRHPRDRSMPRARSGTWSKSSASGTIRRRRRRRPTRSPCRSISTAFTAQGGDTGVVQAMIDAKHPFVPFGGETENGFRKFCGKYSKRRPRLLVGRHRPGAGRGRDQDGDRRRSRARSCRNRSSCRSPSSKIRTSRTGSNYYSDQSDNFFVGNAFPTCGINFTAQEIMGQTEANQ